MKILVYADEGVGPVSLRSSLRQLREVLAPSFSISLVSHLELKQLNWEESTALLVFPGGRDLPYHQLLRGKANQKIRRFVEEGGSYLGICAGAYYGAAEIQFDPGHPLQVCGKRELAFFPGLAVGPAYGFNTFEYESGKGACLASTEWTFPEEEKVAYKLYYKGGCCFPFAESYPSVHVLARYQDLPNQPAAAVYCRVGEGQALLCGLHPEISAEDLNSQDPYIQSFFNALKESEPLRQKLWQDILALSLRTQKVLY